MDEYTIECNVCDKVFNPDAVHLKDVYLKGSCSFGCYTTACRAGGMYQVINKMRNLLSYSEFQKIFEFGEAGGYAEDKYDKYRQAPHSFYMSLSLNNIIKMAKHF